MINGGQLANTGTINLNHKGNLLNEGGTLTNSATVNVGAGTNGFLFNDVGGTVNNSGLINIDGDSVSNYSGTFNNNAGGIIININNLGGLSNEFTSIAFNNNGAVNKYCGGVFGNSGTFTGKPIVDKCTSATQFTLSINSADFTPNQGNVRRSPSS